MNSTKTIMLVSAGKLATIPGTSVAEGKEEAPKERPPLALHEMANPIDAIVPPMNHGDYEHKGTSFEQSGEDFKGAGLIFAGEQGEKLRLDFLINHLYFPEGVNELDVFVAYSSSVGYFEDNEYLPGLGDKDDYDDSEERAGHMGDHGKRPVYKPGKPLGDRVKPNKQAPKPPQVGAGKLCLDMTNVQILAGVRVKALQQLIDTPTPLGQALPNPNSVSVSVNLSDLHNFEGDELYFQAMAVPVGETINFPEAQVSECDRFFIVKPEEGQPGSGSKADPLSGSNGTTDGQDIPSTQGKVQ
ncbi:hypothetical protein [Candidatus Marithrix sp. Canyon 246]|uniref:hypothetical protein n=1 Tax=Candidatus Marithrix sp. Canyon 246 TaxID=1827136 RepID=UPI00084A006A|nr:hypothetical protein [Candidatus Marithrix sp. Canyon 246]